MEDIIFNTTIPFTPSHHLLESVTRVPQKHMSNGENYQEK